MFFLLVNYDATDIDNLSMRNQSTLQHIASETKLNHLLTDLLLNRIRIRLKLIIFVVVRQIDFKVAKMQRAVSLFNSNVSHVGELRTHSKYKIWYYKCAQSVIVRLFIQLLFLRDTQIHENSVEFIAK